MAHTNYELIMEFQKAVLDYLEGEKLIVEAALKVYEPQAIQDSDADIRKMREAEAIKLRDRLNELNRHIAVIKLMAPSK